MNARDRKYRILTRILDKLVDEGKSVARRQKQFRTETEDLKNSARSRAFLHLYLMTRYGVVGFEDREHMITDGSDDGGIDAYFIDTNAKVIDVVQAKFRANPVNFEEKFIQPEELLSVELDRVLSGEEESASGSKYNGYIQAFIEKLQKISDIARYSTRVTILANVKKEHIPLVERLFHGFEGEIVNFDRCYLELVLPTLRGEQHYTPSLRLRLDLSNKSQSSKLSAEIATAHGASEITVVLVPTIEIAELMSRYKNSILRYNPRSYLEFREQKTNDGIYSSIVDFETGEFALLNNGITIVSDETYVSERVGQKNTAQVEIVNPQIINGGQTAFTLSRIFDESNDIERATRFAGKEVVVRIITLPSLSEELKKDFVLQISTATNSQTVVTAADRTASNDSNREISERFFVRTGLLFEPKRGEYADSIYRQYLNRDEIIERAIFNRICMLTVGQYTKAIQRRLLKSTGGVIDSNLSDEQIDRTFRLYELYKEISGPRKGQQASTQIAVDLADTLFAETILLEKESRGEEISIEHAVELTLDYKEELRDWAEQNFKGFRRTFLDPESGKAVEKFNFRTWRKSKHYPKGVSDFVSAALL